MKTMVKVKIKEIVAHNGAIVIVSKDTSYSHTECDKVMAAWREQEYQRKRDEKQQQKRSIFKLFRRKKVA